MSINNLIGSIGCLPEEEDFMSNKIRYRDGYKHQLADAYKIKLKSNPVTQYNGEWFDLDINGMLTIKRNYCWDGASGPTWDTKNCKRGSLVHDALYQLMRMEVLPKSYRKHADKLFYDILREDGMWYIRAKLWYRSVRLGAGSSADPKSLKKIYVAP